MGRIADVLTGRAWGRNRPQRRSERSAFAVRNIDISMGATTLSTHKQEWQAHAWAAYRDNVGEFASVVNWRANAISRANLFVAKVGGDSSKPEPVKDNRLEDILAKLGTGSDAGYSQMLKRMAIHLDVPGETILVGTQTQYGPLWFPASADQIEPFGDGLAVKIDETGLIDDNGQPRDYLPVPRPQSGQPTTTQLKRIYEPDPLYPWLAISPGRHAQKQLRIIDRLTDRVNANTLSRLTNKILMLNSQVMLPTMPDRADLHPDPQMAGLIYTGMTAVANPESPAAVMPIIARVPGIPSEAHDEIDMGTSFDEQLVPLFDLFIRRLALTLNVPPEILLGMASQSNHWSAWLVSDDTVRIHISPTLELICDALTRAYLQPAIAELNRRAGTVLYNPGDYVVWYDTVRITQRPNRAENALDSYAAGVIDANATRTAGGWDGSDAPDPAEIKQRILLDALVKGHEPEVVSWYLDQLGLTGVTIERPTAAPSLVPGGAAPAAPGAIPSGPGL